jgi:5-methylcytosine-specific restriction endonuclease McrA
LTNSRRLAPIALAEKVLALLDEGRFTATYKYAVLLALTDLCLERTSRDGFAPDTITTRQLAEKVIEIYWPHCQPYHGGADPVVLKQNAGRADSQAEIVRAITAFRTATSSSPSSQVAHARVAAGEAFERLVDDVEWTLIEMPLPRLQRFASGYDRFLYSIGWDKGIRKGVVGAYQRGEPGDFDNRIHLTPGAGEHLVLLNGLLRPLIQQKWAEHVARMNGLAESRLTEFLFGVSRVALDRLRPGLQELQDNRCFYCGERHRDTARYRPQVDHFVPWARYPNNAIENLVVAHEHCNGAKRDYMAASEHLARWRGRLDPDGRVSADLVTLAGDADWESDAGRSLGVARGIYLHLPSDVPLWLRGKEFVEFEPERLARILA